MYMEPKKTRRAGTLAALLVAGAGYMLAPEASAKTQTLQERVSVADLDLNTASGQREFDRRLRVAIRRVCETPLGAASFGSKRELVECRRQAREFAYLQLQVRGLPVGFVAARN